MNCTVTSRHVAGDHIVSVAMKSRERHPQAKTTICIVETEVESDWVSRVESDPSPISGIRISVQDRLGPENAVTQHIMIATPAIAVRFGVDQYNVKRTADEKICF